MRNVVLNKLTRLVFTEQQLRAYWKKLGEDLAFDSLTNEQIMKLAVKMFEDSSYSQLEQHILGRGWRTLEETEGKMIAEDDSKEDMHIELIDTSQDGSVSRILIDRVLQLQCSGCGFVFYIDHLDADIKQVKCPACSGQVEYVRRKRILKRG